MGVTPIVAEGGKSSYGSNTHNSYLPNWQVWTKRPQLKKMLFMVFHPGCVSSGYQCVRRAFEHNAEFLDHGKGKIAFAA